MSTSQNTHPHHPLAETEASFSAAARVVRATGSYPRDRAMATLSLAGMLGGGAVIGITVTGLLARLAGPAIASVVFLGLVLAFVFLGLPAIERRFFAMRCAFAFLATEALLRRRPIPPTGTAEAAQRFLTESFGDLAGPVYDAHMDVRRLVVSFFRTFDRLDELLPIDLGPTRRALAFLVDRIAPNVADLALSYAVAQGRGEYAETARDAVALVAQNPKAMLGTAVRAWFVERALGGLVGFFSFALIGGGTFAATMAMATSAAAESGMPGEGATTVGIFAAVFASLLVGAPLASLASWFVRTAFVEPVALTMLLVRFHVTIQGQSVDPNVRARLANANGDLGTARGLASLFD